MDKRNSENSMPYFPTEQDWTLAVRPSRIPLEEHFLGKFLVNSLPIYRAKHTESALRDPRGKGKGRAPLLQNAPKCGHRLAERPEHSYPNTIPVDRDTRQTHVKPNKGVAQDPLEQLGWLEEDEEHLTIKEHLSRIHASDDDFIAQGATSQV
jgi:hypothetical protein